MVFGDAFQFYCPVALVSSLCTLMNPSEGEASVFERPVAPETCVGWLGRLHSCRIKLHFEARLSIEFHLLAY